MIAAKRVIKLVFLSLIFCGLLAGTVFAAYHFANSQSKTSNQQAKACNNPEKKHKVVIQHDKVSPAHTEAKACDQLTVMNMDDQSRLIAFGQHDKHMTYDGIEERLLAQNQSFTVTLDNIGNYRFHDHLDDNVQGTFKVR